MSRAAAASFDPVSSRASSSPESGGTGAISGTVKITLRSPRFETRRCEVPESVRRLSLPTPAAEIVSSRDLPTQRVPRAELLLGKRRSLAQEVVNALALFVVVLGVTMLAARVATAAFFG